MKKIDLIRMWQSRTSDGELIYTQKNLAELLDALLDTLRDVFEYEMDIGEYIRLSSDVALSVKSKPSRVYQKTTLKNIITGEPIEVEARTIPAKKTLVLKGFEKEI